MALLPLHYYYFAVFITCKCIKIQNTLHKDKSYKDNILIFLCFVEKEKVRHIKVESS